MNMRLVKKKTQQPIVEFQEERTIFYNKFLENEMRSIGIIVPHGLRGVYGKDCVYLDDSIFQKAFKEIYYLTSMDPKEFEWQ